MIIRTTLAIAALAFLAPSAPVRAEDSPKAGQSVDQQQAQLQGMWEGVEVGRESEGKATMKIDGDSIEFQGATKKEWYKATFTLPSGKDPKQLRATIKESPEPEYVGKTSVAIFKIEDGTLTLVGNKPGTSDVPQGFKDGEGTRTFVFKKAGAEAKAK